MRLCVVAHYYPPHVGGLEVVAQQVARALVRRGHDVTIVTSEVREAAASECREDGVRVIRIPTFNVLDEKYKIPFPLFLRGIADIFRAVRASDIVHIHDVFYLTSWAAYCAARFYHKPIVLTQHVALVDHPSALIQVIQKLVYATWGHWIFKASTRIIVYNAIVKNFLIERGVDRHTLLEVRNGVSIERFRPAREGEKKAAREKFKLPNRPLALFVGRFVPKKGITEFLDAKRAGYDLVLAGAGSIEKKDGVHVVGALSHDDLADLYRAVDVCVIPSKRELITLTLQEAAASGLPIITTNEPEYSLYDLDREKISLVDRTGAAIAQALETLFADSDVRARMSQYSREIAEKWFDEKRNIDRVVAIIESCAPERVVTTSWDDGHKLDFKVATLLKKYRIRGTFYISPEDRELDPSVRLTKEDVQKLAENFEIGAHTLTHPYLPDVDATTAEKEIRASKEVLESWTGMEITSFCYPKGGYSHDIEAITEKAGFARARTVERFSLSVGNDPYAIPTTIHTYDHWSDIWPVLKLARFNPIRFFGLYHRWDEQAKALFDRMLEHGGTFHLWGHSWELEQHNDWERFEQVLRYIARKDGLLHLSNGEIER